MPIELVGISHRYGADPPVLTGISLLVEPGTLVAVMGPSGSGKSTLLAIAGLLMRPWRGEVRHEAQPIVWRGQLGPVDRAQVAWVFQSSNLFARRTAVENTMMGPLARGLPVEVSRRMSLDALGQLEVGHLAEVPARQISGGEAQRVGVARALASRCRYLFADEPTGQLDTATTSVVLRALERRTNDGWVTVIATHDRAVAEACDRVYTMRDGHLSLGV